ncbi:hypothetical protein MCOR14_010940 [Pyricularia oryzae]|nr:hypothetical protein MCOR17_011034 [Pyricularia oryzae]KAI6479604.1 hypothetical protein MCOR13_011402 [Pyricularia oryzae]KAI6616714.1 hypothetical protein MCOR14_010940 [Pyricularia oryzae]
MPPAKRHREADTSEREPKITPEDFTVGWICALPIELAAAAEIMDEEFAECYPGNSRTIIWYCRVRHLLVEDLLFAPPQ